MFKDLMQKLTKPKKPVRTPEPYIPDYPMDESGVTLNTINTRVFQRTAADFRVNGEHQIAMDSGLGGVKNLFAIADVGVPQVQLAYFAEQSFIGYQLCAMLAQHWLIDKACSLPGEDATRNWFDVSFNNGDDVVASKIKEDFDSLNKSYKLSENLVEFIRMGRTFGIRLLLFEVDSPDPNYYYNPFNIDGVLPGTYRGMTQIDPFWITPELDYEAASNPRSKYFYEPTWWRVNGQLIHRSHFVIMRTNTVPDVLKPTYYYGGIPIPQQIYYRVFCAERTANEAPELTLTKRLTYVKTDLEQALMRPGAFQKRMRLVTETRNNYGLYMMGLGEEAGQFDTALSDLDAVIMTQYQLVAAAAKVPAVKLLGTSPKGFNATGEYEQKSYNEYLKNIQSHNLTPAVERHYLMMVKSDIAPKYNIETFNTRIMWNPLSEMSALEKAELNKLNADTGAVLIASGAIDSEIERRRIISDPNSGYDGLEIDSDEDDSEDDDSIDSILNKLDEAVNAQKATNEETTELG